MFVMEIAIAITCMANKTLLYRKMCRLNEKISNYEENCVNVVNFT